MPQPTAAHDFQHTLGSSVSISGHGLFTGACATVTLHPAPADSGRVFRRTDLPGSPVIPARAEFAVERLRRTALERDGASVEMVEHCLSALCAFGVDNAVIELDSPELPAGDGSALPYVDAIRAAEVRAQSARRRAIIVRQTITVAGDGSSASALPLGAGHTGTQYTYMLDYGPGAPIPPQSVTFDGGPDDYVRDIAPARTFSTRQEAESARARGMFAHLSPRDMLVIDHTGPLDNAYRLPDEPARHKLVDLIGDLALVGHPIVGRIIATKSGHAVNLQLARELLRQAGAPA